MTHHHIDIQRIGRDRYTVYLGAIPLFQNARLPLLESARKLIDMGYALDDQLTMCRDGVPCLTGVVGALAKLTVRETDHSGPKFVKWTPFTWRG